MFKINLQEVEHQQRPHLDVGLLQLRIFVFRDHRRRPRLKELDRLAEDLSVFAMKLQKDSLVVQIEGSLHDSTIVETSARIEVRIVKVIDRVGIEIAKLELLSYLCNLSCTLWKCFKENFIVICSF